MNQRDRTFLQDMANFIYMNHVATAFALAEAINTAPMIAAKTVHGIHAQPHELMEASYQEAFINELSRSRIASVQSIMIARIFAELIATYENLGHLVGLLENEERRGGVSLPGTLKHATEGTHSFIKV